MDANGQTLDPLGNFFCPQLVPRKIKEPPPKKIPKAYFFQIATRSPFSTINTSLFEY